MKIQKTKGLFIALAALIVVGFAIPTTAEAGGYCYSHRCGCCGASIYKRMIHVGCHPCGRPIYRWSICSHSCRPIHYYRPSYSYRYSYTPRYYSYRSGCGTSSIVSGIVSGLLHHAIHSSHHHRHHRPCW
jgi:hypothetical protein